MNRHRSFFCFTLSLFVSLAVLAGCSRAAPVGAQAAVGRPAETTVALPASPSREEGPAAGPEKVTPIAAGTPVAVASEQAPAGTADDVLPPRVEKLADGRLQRERLVRRNGKYPLIRIEETVTQGPDGLQVTATREMVADHILVSIAPGHTAAEVAAAAGCTVRHELPGSGVALLAFTYKAHADYAVNLQRLAAANSVRNAESDWIIHLNGTPSGTLTFNDPLLAQQWGMDNQGQSGGKSDADIDAPEAWAIHTGSKSVLVGVLDTGIDYNHPDLVANMWWNPGESGLDAQGRDKSTNGIDDDGNGYVDDWRGWDFLNNDNDPADDNGHGTHCAGIIGASGGNGTGVVGVCPNVSLVGLKWIDANGYGWTSDAIGAVLYSSRIGCKITSNSWGSNSYSLALKEAIDQAGTQGRLFVAAAGNYAGNNDVYPVYPSSYDSANIIAVASTDRVDSLSDFSCFGAASVDLGAPGTDIISCWPGGRYVNLSGTSMATPHVAGACALLLAAHPSLTAQKIKEQILTRGDPIPALAGKTVSGRRLNVSRTLTQKMIQVTPASLDLQVAVGGIATGELAIANAGDAPLEWSIAPSVQPLVAESIEPSGQIRQSSRQTFDGFPTWRYGLEPGEGWFYEAALTLKNVQVPSDIPWLYLQEFKNLQYFPWNGPAWYSSTYTFMLVDVQPVGGSWWDQVDSSNSWSYGYGWDPSSWKARSINLTRYAGTAVNIRFSIKSLLPQTIDRVNSDGWYIGNFSWYDMPSRNPNPWLSATPASGTLAPGANAKISVQASMAGRSADDYFGKLSITSDDPRGPVQVPVKCSVIALPVITSPSTASGEVGRPFTFQIQTAPSKGQITVSANGLPPGFSLNPSTGLISGTPSVSGNASILISVMNIGGTVQQTLNLIIAPAPLPVITSPSTASGEVGVPFAFQIQTAPSLVRTTFSASGLPPGLTLDSNSGLISGTPSVMGGSRVVLSATNVTGTTQQTLDLSIAHAPIMVGPWIGGTTHAVEAGSKRALVVQVQAVHSRTIAATGVSYGGRPLTKVVESLGFNGSGLFSVYTAAFVLTEADIAAATSGTISVSWTVKPIYSSFISSAFISNVDQANPVGATVAAWGDPIGRLSTEPIASTKGDLLVLSAVANSSGAYTLFNGFVQGWTPSGLVIGAAVTGTKKATGTAEAVSVLQSTNKLQAVLGFALRWAGAAGGTTPTYTVSYDANGGVGSVAPATKTQNVALTLPTGSNLSRSGYGFMGWNSAANGSGTAYAAGGSYTANATATLYAQWAALPVITSPTTASGTVGTAFSYQIVASNAPTAFNASGLPAGLTVNTGSGLISGTPSVAGSSNVVLSARNAAGTAQQTVSLTIANPVIATYTVSYDANGGVGSIAPATKTQNVALTLPTGSSLSRSGYGFMGWNSAANGSGTAYAAGGSYTANATATLYAQWAALPVITSPTTASGTVGTAFSYQIVASNAPTAFNASGLPAGLTVNTGSGLISGTPSVAGSSNVVLSARNAAGTVQQTLNLTIVQPPAEKPITVGPWIGGTTHAVEAGSSRALVVVVQAVHTTTIAATGVSYGGRPLTKVVESLGWRGRGFFSVYTAAFLLTESDIVAATSGTIRVTWTATPALGSSLSSAFMANVDQTTPVGATSAVWNNSIASLSTGTLANTSGDLLVLSAVANSAGAYSLGNGFVQGWAPSGVTWGAAVTGTKSATGTTEAITVTQPTAKRQAMLGFALKRAWAVKPVSN